MSALSPGEKVRRIQEVCPIPETASRVMRLCAEPDCDLSKVARVLTTDAALSAEVMRLANSPGFGGRREVAELGQAVSMVGVNRLGQIATAMAMLGAFRCSAEKALPFHNTSLLSGALARQLAGRLKQNQSTAFVLGLLCEIGAMACVAVDAKAYSELYLAAPDLPGRWQAETLRYEATSASLGAELLSRNGLPDELCESIGTQLGRDAESPLARVTAFTRQVAPHLQASTAESTDGLAELLPGWLEDHGLALKTGVIHEVCGEALRLSSQALSA